MASVNEIYNYLPIDGKLSTSGQPSEEELAAAAKAGFEVVINLALHDDPRYSLADETGCVRDLGMTYVHIPVRFDGPTQDDLEAFFDAMEAHRGRRILVHCAANKRVTSFLGLYRAIREAWELERAFAEMNKIWEPNPVWRSFISAMLDKHRPASGALPGNTMEGP